MTIHQLKQTTEKTFAEAGYLLIGN